MNVWIMFHEVPYYAFCPNIYHFIFPGQNIFLNTLFPNVPLYIPSPHNKECKKSYCLQQINTRFPVIHAVLDILSGTLGFSLVHFIRK